jgi:hypothetical protein
VWVNIYFIDLGELNRRADIGWIIRLGVLREVVLLIVSVFLWARESHCAAFYKLMERGSVLSPGLSGSPRRTW